MIIKDYYTHLECEQMYKLVNRISLRMMDNIRDSFHMDTSQVHNASDEKQIRYCSTERRERKGAYCHF